TLSAAAELFPAPCVLPPRSLTTTRAPLLANRSACERPSPLPAPVMTATFPSKRSSFDMDLEPSRLETILRANYLRAPMESTGNPGAARRSSTFITDLPHKSAPQPSARPVLPARRQRHARRHERLVARGG